MIESENVRTESIYNIVTFHIFIMSLEQHRSLGGYFFFESKNSKLIFIFLSFWIMPASRKNLLPIR